MCWKSTQGCFWGNGWNTKWLWRPVLISSLLNRQPAGDISHKPISTSHFEALSWYHLDDFPRSQHRPSLVHVGLTLPVICSTGIKQWNFLMANWDTFSASTDKRPFHHSPVPNSSRRRLQPLHQSHVQSSSLHYPQESLYYVCTLHGRGSPGVTGWVRKIRWSR